MKKKGNNTKLIAYGGAAVGVAVLAYLLWPQQPAAATDAPPAPGAGGSGTDVPVKPPNDEIPTHRPSKTTTAGVGSTTTSSTNPPPPPPPPTSGVYVPGRDRPGGGKIDTNAPCSSGGMDYATLYRMGDMLRGQKSWVGSNPDAIRAQAQALANTIFQYGLDACLALSTFSDGDSRLSDSCRQAAQQTAAAANALRSEFGAELPCPDQKYIDNWTGSALYQNNPAARACIDAAVARCSGAGGNNLSSNKMAVSSGQERLRLYYDQLGRDDRVINL